MNNQFDWRELLEGECEAEVILYDNIGQELAVVEVCKTVDQAIQLTKRLNTALTQ